MEIGTKSDKQLVYYQINQLGAKLEIGYHRCTITRISSRREGFASPTAVGREEITS